MKKRFALQCFGVLLGTFLILPSVSVHAQGLKTLQDKYGAPTSAPLKTKDRSSSQNQNTTGNEGVPDGMLMLNGVDVDIKDMIKLISNVTGKNFILGDKIRGKITIISETPMSYEMAYQAFLSALEANGYTTTMTPSGLINVVPHKGALQKPLELFKDSSPVTDKYITRIIQLSNISANEISQVIKEMVSKEGSMQPYPTTNSLIVTDTGSNIDRILKLVSELDQEGPQEVLEIVPIVNADAKDIAGKVTEIFKKEDAQPTRTTRRSSRRSRNQSSDLKDVQAISKVIADERTNSVLILGTKRAIIKVKALIAKLDRTISGVEGSIHVYYLKHANSKEMSEVLSNLVADSNSKKTSSSKSSKAKASAPAKSGSVQLQGGVKVTADEATNSLIITASPKDFTVLVDRVVKKLDIKRPQVYLEAVIMSLSVSKRSTLGFFGNAGLVNTLASGNSLSFFGSLLPTSSSVLSSIAGVSGAPQPGGVAGGVISSNTIDFTLADGNTVSIPAISGIINALKSDSNANILSTPSILTMDNQEAQIQVGQNVPVRGNETLGASGSTSFSIDREDVGVILKITPQISEGEYIRLDLTQELSSVDEGSATNPLGPTINKRSASTTVTVPNMQTMVIGGLIDDQESVQKHKVPLLGDIPVLGALFRNTVKTRSRSNLVMFITPHIVRGPQDSLAILKKKIEERNAFINNNYGVRDRKNIRRAIQSHAADLLEFKCDLSIPDNPCAHRFYDRTKSQAVRRYEEKVKKTHR